MKKFNINDYMYIQITDFGWEHLRNTLTDSYIEHCIENKKIKIENQIWYKLQCHTVFELFPVKFFTQPLFNTNVMFDDVDLLTL